MTPTRAAAGSSGPVATPSPTLLDHTVSPSLEASPTPTPNPVESPGTSASHVHIMVIVLENKEYSDVIGNSKAPYLNSLAQRFGLATASYGMAHPSLPNYLELVSGSTHGITDDCTSCSVSGENLGSQMTDAGVAWKAYFEGLPSSCFAGGSSAQGYEKKHNPFMYFDAFANNPADCSHTVSLDALANDLAGAEAPDFVWITPDSCHSGHDCSLGAADSWLATFVPMIQASAWYEGDAHVIITWDEGVSDAGCCKDAKGGHIVTLVLGPKVAPGSRLATPVDHAGVLRTIEDYYGLDYLGDASCACSGDLHLLMDPR